MATEIAAVFNALFARSHRVRLAGGGEEPLYRPATAGAPALIRYTRDYPRSALHEAAHWCIAGAARRRLEDYGYYYQPPPRSPAERRAFVTLEARAQALEAIFAAAAGLPFAVSVDDVDNALDTEAALAAAVAGAMAEWLRRGLSDRARRFEAALARRRLRRGRGK